MVPENNIINNDYNAVNSNSNNKEEENIFDQDFNEELEMSLKITLNPQVLKALKNLQPSYNEDPNKNCSAAKQEKAVMKNLIFLTDLAVFAMVTLDEGTTEKELKNFNKA